jgi:gluconate 5-dehydrogenase
LQSNFSLDTTTLKKGKRAMAVQAQTLTQLKERLNQDLFDLRGRVAIVTGGSSGIGKAMAAGLAHYGARVAIAGSNAGKCEVAADELRRIEAQVLPLPTDVSDPDQVRSMVERTVNKWGRLDILINSAGVYQGVSAFEMSVAEWRRVMAVDLDGAFYCCQAAGRAMVETFQACWATPMKRLTAQQRGASPC